MMDSSRQSSEVLSCEEICSLSTPKSIVRMQTPDADPCKYFLRILKSLSNAIYEDDINLLKEIKIVIDETVWAEFDLCDLYADIENPLRNTNIVILACKLNSSKVVEYVFSCENRILDTFSNKIGGTSVFPQQEDEFHHNAFYYSIRNGNVDILETLIYYWPGCYFATRSEELNVLLSKAYLELKLKNVVITKEMEICTESMLLNIHFHSTNILHSSEINMTKSKFSIKEQIDITIDNINFLVFTYLNKEIDDKCLLTLKFIANNVSVLKQKLKSEYARLPWDKMEFLLVIFIFTQTNQLNSDLIYCATLTKDKILNYMQAFLHCLAKEYYMYNSKECSEINVSGDNSTEYPSIFMNLNYDYNFVKIAYSLETMQAYLETVVSADQSLENTSVLLSRCIQVVKKHIGNNAEFPKFSQITNDFLFESLSASTRDLILCKCNPMYYILSLSVNQKETEERNREVFNGLLEDLKKLNNVISDELTKSKLKALAVLLEQIICGTSLDEVKEFIEIIDTLNLNEISLSNVDMRIEELIENFITHLNKFVVDKTMYEQHMICEIHEIINRGNSELTSIETNYELCFELLENMKFYIRGKILLESDYLVIKKIANKIIMNLISSMKPQNIETILELIVNIWNSIVPRMQSGVNEMYKIVLQMMKIIEFQTTKCTWISELWKKFNTMYLVYKSQKMQENNVIHCLHTKFKKKFNININDVLPNCVKNFVWNQNNYLNNYEVNTQLFNSFLYYKQNRNVQKIVEALVLQELSVYDYSNSFVSDNLLVMEQSCLILFGEKLYNFLSHGCIAIDAQLCDPLTAIFLNAMMLSCYAFLPEEIRCTKTDLNDTDIPTLKLKHDEHTAIVTNQENMYIALKEGKLETVKKCLKYGADLNGRNLNKWTALHFAATGSSVDSVKFLIDQNHSVYVKDAKGQSPLHIAVKCGQINIVEYFVMETNMYIDDVDNTGKTPLLFAIQNGFKDIAFILMRNKNNFKTFSSINSNERIHCAKVSELFYKNEMQSHCLTLLHFAAGSGCVELTNIFCESKENVNVKNNIQGTPLHIAATNGYLHIVQNLISKGACVNDQNRDGCIPLHNAVENAHEQIVSLLLEKGSNVNLMDKVFNYTPLMYAVQGGYKLCAELLLRKGANVDVLSSKGMSPLHFAVIKGFMEMVDLLIKSGACVNVASKNGNTALHFSAMKDNKEILEHLINNGGCVNAQNNENKSLLHVACENGCKNVVKLLIDKNIGIHKKDLYGCTPLHLSCQKNYIHIVDLLLEKGATVNIGDKNKRTPLHIAALYNRSAVIDVLINKGADIHCRDNDGFTALHLASLNGCINVIQKLIAYNANVNAANMMGISSLHVAVQGNHSKAVEILIQKGSIINAKVSFGCSLLNNSNTNWEEKLHKDILELFARQDSPFKNFQLQNFEKKEVFERRIYSPLYFAVYNNNALMVNKLVTNGAHVFVKDNICFLTSVYFGYKCILEILLKEKDMNDIPLEDSAHLLFVAAFKGYEEIMKTLLGKGACVNGVFPPFEITPLYAAVEAGHSNLVKLLISKNAKVNMMDVYGTTPLHRAAAQGHKNVVEVLLESNEIPVHLRDSAHTTCLEHAVANGHKEIVELLLQDQKININMKGKNGFSLLHIAALKGKFEITRFLIDKGADVHISNIFNFKPIHVAAREGHINIVELFLSFGIDVNTRGAGDHTCLHCAVAGAQAKMVNFLLRKNCDINATDSNGLTALHLAAVFCSKNIVQILLENGAYYNVVDKAEGNKPLDVVKNEQVAKMFEATEMIFNAVKDDNPFKLELCIRNGGVVNARNKENATPLMFAAWKGSMKIVNVLLRNNANPNIIGKGGCTPLHFATRFSHLKIVMRLLSCGAIYNIENLKQKIPLDVAVNPDIKNLLMCIDRCFVFACNGDIKLIIELMNIKDAEYRRSISNACNREEQSLIVYAHDKGYPFMEDLKKVLYNISAPTNLGNVLLAQNKYEEDMNVLLQKH